MEKNHQFPNGLEFSIQFLQLTEGYWSRLVRIDNQMHRGKSGTHIHQLNGRVSWESMTFQEAEKRIIAIAEKLKVKT